MRRFTKILRFRRHCTEDFARDFEGQSASDTLLSFFRCRIFRARKIEQVLNAIVTEVKRNLSACDHAFPKK
jgi:hypothetical protein